MPKLSEEMLLQRQKRFEEIKEEQRKLEKQKRKRISELKEKWRHKLQ